MRISDWSSDVCSSDLEIFADEQQFRPPIAKDEAAFGGREAAVDRCETGPRTRRPEKERIPAVMVFGQRRNAVTRRDVRSGQRVRDTVRPDRKSVVWGRRESVRVDLGGSRTIKK